MTTTTDRPQPRTAAALAARRRDTQAALERVHQAITRLRRTRHRSPLPRSRIAPTCPGPSSTPTLTRKPLSPKPSGRPPNETASKTSRATAVRRAGANVRSTPSTRSRPRTTRSSPADTDRRAARPHPRPGSRMDPGRDPARHHREHHTQAACPPAHRRQPHPGRTPQRRPLQPALPRPAYRRPRSPPCRPQRRPLISRTDTLLDPRQHRVS